MKLTKEQKAALKTSRKSNWRAQIVKYLSDKTATSLEIYNATRPDRLDIPDAKKVHNVASQLTYLSDDGYLWTRDNDKIVLIADPQDNVYKHAEQYVPKQ
jgi:hypothetical protein